MNKSAQNVNLPDIESSRSKSLNMEGNQADNQNLILNETQNENFSSTEQSDEEDSSQVNNEEPFAVELEEDPEDNIDRVVNLEAVRDSYRYWSNIQEVKIIPQFEFNAKYGTRKLCIDTFFEQGIYYSSSNHTYLCQGDSGSVMILEHQNDQPQWRCNGRVVNVITKEKCCLGTPLSVQTDSFFANRSLQEQDVMLILWNWCHRVRKITIAEMAGCSVKSVSGVLDD
ncbi:unnamed protein product [Rhizopus stolonifer]